MYLQVDESSIQVLENSGKKGSSHKGYLWTYHAPVDGLVFLIIVRAVAKQGRKEYR
jgi:transposase